jgi:cellulose synthase (UDP-forming)
MTRFQRWSYRVLMVVGVGSGIVFYAWWLQPEHIPRNFHGWWHIVDVVIFLLLTAVISHRAFMDLYAWVVVRKVQKRTPAPVPEPGLRVAFITTFVPGVEGMDLLKRTLPAMTLAEYPHDTWLLDEGNSQEASELCEALGVRYFTRNGSREYNLVAGPFTARTKGGNHNAWYDKFGHQYDIVAQIDTDFLPGADFLIQTLGYFKHPEVGWVGTPQIYGNMKSIIARGAAQQQYSFYGPVLRGLGGRNMANMIGANHIVRVAALNDIRFYAGHLTEDLLTGMRLHSLGWKSVYVPEPLAIGEGPETWKAYFNQQMRWAYGCIDILRWHTPALTKSMSKSQAALYVSLQQGYFSGIAGLIGVILLSAYFFGGIEISRIPLIGFLEWGITFWLMRHLISLWMQQFNVRPKEERGLFWAGRMIGIAVWPIYLLAFVGVMRQRPLVFKVTPKGDTAREPAAPLRLFRPHLILALVSLACVIAGVTQKDPSPVLMAWATVNALLLGAFVVSAAWMALLQNVRDRRQRIAVPAAVHPNSLSDLAEANVLIEGGAVAPS